MAKVCKMKELVGLDVCLTIVVEKADRGTIRIVCSSSQIGKASECETTGTICVAGARVNCDAEVAHITGCGGINYAYLEIQI